MACRDNGLKGDVARDVAETCVGTLCWMLLFLAGPGDPLFLQVKEARASVLELGGDRQFWLRATRAPFVPCALAPSIAKAEDETPATRLGSRDQRGLGSSIIRRRTEARADSL